MTSKPQPEMTSERFRDLIQLIQTLRGPDGCPWDKKQTPRSIALYLIEEIYELVEAIESGNSDNIREELGDVLFQVFFIAELFREGGRFDIGEVALRTTKKMMGDIHMFSVPTGWTVAKPSANGGIKSNGTRKKAQKRNRCSIPYRCSCRR